MSGSKRRGRIRKTFHHEQVVRESLALIESRDPSASENCYFSIRFVRANRLQSGNGHDRIADPIRGADENFQSEISGRLSIRISVALRQKPAGSWISSDTLQTHTGNVRITTP